MNNNKIKISIFSICMYVFAAIILIYFIFLLVQTKTLVSDAVAAGQLSLENDMSDIVRHYITTCGVYFIYAVIFVAFGYVGNLVYSIVQRGSSAEVSEDTEIVVIDEVIQEEIEDFDVDSVDEEIDVEDEIEADAIEAEVDEPAIDEVTETVQDVVEEAADDDIEIIDPSNEEK